MKGLQISAYRIYCWWLLAKEPFILRCIGPLESGVANCVGVWHFHARAVCRGRRVRRCGRCGQRDCGDDRAQSRARSGGGRRIRWKFDGESLELSGARRYRVLGAIPTSRVHYGREMGHPVQQPCTSFPPTTCMGRLCGSGIPAYERGESSGSIRLVARRSARQVEKSVMKSCRSARGPMALPRDGALPKSQLTPFTGLVKPSNLTARPGSWKGSSVRVDAVRGRAKSARY